MVGHSFCLQFSHNAYTVCIIISGVNESRPSWYSQTQTHTFIVKHGPRPRPFGKQPMPDSFDFHIIKDDSKTSIEKTTPDIVPTAASLTNPLSISWAIKAPVIALNKPIWDKIWNHKLQENDFMLETRKILPFLFYKIDLHKKTKLQMVWVSSYPAQTHLIETIRVRYMRTGPRAILAMAPSEVIMTLQDVDVLWGLPEEGPPVTGPNWSTMKQQ
ncbi:hypothetical protein M9H77_34643 [Catharanthus roseus]|uniref:Uncharacterized protein n=1 Tax=Catharanthus roseus TaxID=4058 RepID=A0ACB9ZNM4_CATRO|nr:hypothetical protein M9H77_34643 [Catharanthus roseus]